MSQSRRDIDEAIANAQPGRRRRRVAGRFFAISFGDILGLLIACVVVGFALAMFNIDPRSFWADLFGGLADAFGRFRENFGTVLGYMAYGAILVVPIWLLVRVLKALR